MSTARKLVNLSPEEYLRSEKTSKVKREFLKGLVFPKAGSSQNHNVISGNLYRTIQDYLSGSRYVAFIEAFKVRIETENCFYYPDVLVAGGELEDGDSVYTDSPVFIAEVLSPATAAIDRREKRSNYLRIPSLRQYSIIHQRRKRVELFQKDDDGNWYESELVSGDEMKIIGLPGPGLTVAIDFLYRNTTVPRGTFGVSEEIEEEYEPCSSEEALLYD